MATLIWTYVLFPCSVGIQASNSLFSRKPLTKSHCPVLRPFQVGYGITVVIVSVYNYAIEYSTVAKHQPMSQTLSQTGGKAH